jgi:hypothetical protein
MFPMKVTEPGPSPSPSRAGFVHKFGQHYMPGRKRLVPDNREVTWLTAPFPAAQLGITIRSPGQDKKFAQDLVYRCLVSVLWLGSLKL